MGSAKLYICVRGTPFLPLMKKLIEVTNLAPFPGQRKRDCCSCCKLLHALYIRPIHTLCTIYTYTSSKRQLVSGMVGLNDSFESHSLRDSDANWETVWLVSNPHFPMDSGSSVRWLKSSLSKVNAFSSPRKGKGITYK